MNCHATLTRSQQRIAQLINIGRPLTDEESDELYRALHADYMRKWRLAKAEAEVLRAEAEDAKVDLELGKMQSRVILKADNERLLKRVLVEAGR